MSAVQLSDKELTQVISAIRKLPQVERAVIFGSRAKGTSKRGSDVDIALFGDAVRRETVVELSNCLNEETVLPYSFDILDFAAIDNPDLIRHIERVGVLIYSKSDA